MSQKKDLSGTFNSLTVINKLDEKINNEEAYLCRCICDTLTNATRHQLLSGRKKTCGCSRRKSPANTLDLQGRKFGMLKVVERAGNTTGGTALWRCQCDCGNETISNATSLKRQNTVSCGCQKSEHIKRALEVLESKSVDGVKVPWLTKKVRADSKSGHKGVHLRERKGRKYYEAHITIKGKRYTEGPFYKLNTAIAARKSLEEKYHQPYIDKLAEQED